MAAVASASDKSVEGVLDRLEDASADVKTKATVAVEIKEHVEQWSQSSQFPVFLDRFVPACLKILDGPPSFISNSPDQKLRNTLLDVCHRLQSAPSEPLAPYAARLVERLMQLMTEENEDNAILCLKASMDLLRHHQKLLSGTGYVQTFLDIVQRLFENTERVVAETLGPTAPAQPPAPAAIAATAGAGPGSRPGTPAGAGQEPGAEQPQQARPLIKALQSFKLLSECPIAVVSVFQAHREVVAANVRNFAPLIKGVLLSQASLQEKAHAEAKAMGTIHFGVAKDIKNKLAFCDLVTAQVKTLSFLAYILRVYGQQLADFLPRLPDIIIRLLRDCPREKCTVRRELLVAIRHIVNFNFRHFLLPVIDDLLDERTLLGDGLTVHEALKPLAYSTLADLIHHIRGSLSIEQIRTTVKVYRANMLCNIPGTSFQTMSAKLLMNMAECIAKLQDKQEARYFLMAILDATGDKFAAMNLQYANAAKVSKHYSEHSPELSADDFAMRKDSPPDWDETDIFSAAPIKSVNPRERGTDPLYDNKFLFRNLVTGLKSVFYQLRACNPSDIVDTQYAPINWPEVACGFSAENVQVLIKLFHEGTKMFQYYESERPPRESNLSPAEILAGHHPTCSREEKELLESFATVFHHVDPATFHEVFHSEIPHIYEMMFDHPALMQVPQFLLASEATSPSFAGMLLQFLVGRIEDVGSADVDKATILLRLFKLSFMAVTLFLQQNEQVLLPHVNKLVTESIRLSTTAEAPIHYFLLLRSLFRSIGGGRFEHLYHEILPLLEMLLDVLNDLIAAARNTQEQDLYVELSLTVPARLSNLLPHLSYLMKPLVLALRAGSDLVSQGLRTLELCVDNLTADYLDPIMAPVIDDLMAALWEHLRPGPYNHYHSHTTMRILGKLGGRNRKFLEGPPQLQFETFSDGACTVDLKLVGATTPSRFPAFLGIKSAIAKLHETPLKASGKAALETQQFQKQRAFKLITTQLKLMLNHDALSPDAAKRLRASAQDLANGSISEKSKVQLPSHVDQSVCKRDEEQKNFKDLLKTVMHAASIPELEQPARSFMSNICKHFAILEVAQAAIDSRHDPNQFLVDSGEGPICIDHRIVAKAIVESLASDKVETRQLAEDVLLSIRDHVTTIFGSSDKILDLPIFNTCLSAFCHSCYEEEWFAKQGGALGLKILATKINPTCEWLAVKQQDIARALLFAAKDLPDDLPQSTRLSALDTLKIVIKNCNQSLSAEDAKSASGPVHGLCSFLVLELAHANRHVREASQDAFSVLAGIAGIEVHELVAPVKDRFLSHIFNKPLRALPFPIQVGYLEAVSFCLRLQNGLLPKDDQMTRFLREASFLAEQENEGPPGRTPDQRHAESVTKLRVACLRLLSLALEIPDYVSSPNNRSRPRIIAVIFKSLYSKHSDVVEAANEALKTVVEKDAKLPKDILQNGLRPILGSLQDSSKLNIENMHCLARLLQILKNYFKVEIATRLIDNIDKMATTDVLQKASFMLVEQQEHINIITSLFNIFHLLPPAANSFMEQVVTRVMDLERQLRRTHFSPFREPLVKYLNRFPQDTWDRFAKHITTDADQSRFFAQIMADERSRPLRDHVSKNMQPLQDALSVDGPDSNKIVAYCNVTHICTSLGLSEDSQKRLLESKPLRRSLIVRAKLVESLLQKNAVGASIRLAAEQSNERAVKILLSYLSTGHGDSDFFIELVNSVTSRELREIPALNQYIYKHIVCSSSVEQNREMILRALDVFTSRNFSEVMKAFMSRNIVIPILAMDVQRNWDIIASDKADDSKHTVLVNKSLLEQFQAKIWKPQAAMDPHDDNTPPNIDLSRMEMLQMTAMIVKYYEKPAQDLRKDIIHLGWAYIRLEDIINKHAAYVVLAYFVSAYPAPAKIVSQVYGTMIAAHVSEARSLVTQALEILAPVVRDRLAREESKIPIWAGMARRSLTEDPSNLQQMGAVFQFITRHPDLFYESKEIFAPLVISSIHRLAPLPTLSIDNKRTALSLINLIWTWEQRHVEETKGVSSPRSIKRKPDGTEVPMFDGPTSFITSATFRLQLLKYLTQFIATLPDRYPIPSFRARDLNSAHVPLVSQVSDICKKSLTLFGRFISSPYWDDLDITAMFPKVTEPPLTEDPKPEEKSEQKPDAKPDPKAEAKEEARKEMMVTRIINTLQLVSAMVNVKSDEWVRDRLPQLQKLLERPIKNASPDIQECLFVEDDEDPLGRKPLVRRILEVIPADSSDDSGGESELPKSEFVQFVSNVASEALGGSNINAGINILKTFGVCRQQDIDSHVPPLMKNLNQHIKDYLSLAQQQAHNAALSQSNRGPELAQAHVQDALAMEKHEQLIIKMIEVLAVRIVQLGDQRRPYLTTLTTLIEKAPKVSLCARIVDLVSEWVLDVEQVLPTVKEKNAVLLKMMSFEHRQDQSLFDKFLDIVIRVYEDPKITRSELAVRLEPGFLVGTRAANVEMRGRFMSLFDRHLSRTAERRTLYLLCQQNWEPLADSFWLSQAIELLFGSVEGDLTTTLASDDLQTSSVATVVSHYSDADLDSVMVDGDFEALINSHTAFLKTLGDVTASSLLEPLCDLQHADSYLAKDIWSHLFPIFWTNLSRDHQNEVKKDILNLLTREWHARQIDKRPNCVQALMEGVVRAQSPRMVLPHHLLKFLARTYDGWYTAITFMEDSAIDPIVDTPAARESNMDALATLYADLQEDDLFYGLWRRRSQFLQTNTALSYEQVGIWERAQRTFETATIKARTGEAPFSQGEYMLWEDHWVICAQKLQQWDILSDFAKVDNLNDLYLDSVWRQFDRWQSSEQLKQLDTVVKSVADAPTPRRMFFQSFMALLKLNMGQETPQAFSRVCDESIQLSIRKWHQLPERITNAHIPILQSFQQLVELHDASVICGSLNSTSQANLDHKAPELKLLLGTWRDRLPNFWDDINAWQDLVTWRRHIFQLVNEKYLSLIPQQQNSATGNSYAYRGYHETAWTINKFAHVARKHGLPEVCIHQLSTIYTLPNIEIQEAFLKLREQAKCHYQSQSELQTGLDVINNTNLSFFGPQQKAEFYTLKGMFHCKQHMMNEANESFGSALSHDLKLPKAWAEWARYNEQLFKADPTDISKAAAALSCYLEAAGCYKNSKSRKAISRVLWLLSLDDANGAIATTYDDYKGEMPVWYWITFIPQLLGSISKPEARISKQILLRIAKHFPQSLYFHLRTSREDFAAIRKQHDLKMKGQKVAQSSPSTNQGSSDSRPTTKEENKDGPAQNENGVEDTKQETPAENGTPNANGQADNKQTPQKQRQSVPPGSSGGPRQPWEHLEEISSVLKTSGPLLALSMETMVDQVARNLKSSPDEEACRLITALLNDVLVYASRAPRQYQAGSKLPSSTETNLSRFAESVLPAHIRPFFDADFTQKWPDLPEYINKLRKWRDRFEEKLDRRQAQSNLEGHGTHLSEFKFQKFEEVEIPGQYLLHKDRNQDFVRIERFLPEISLTRAGGLCFRRLKIRGHDGSTHCFTIQHPTPRTCRREERMMQMFRFFNDTLARRKESRRRKLHFNTTAMIPITPAIRMIQDDPSYVTLQGIYDDYCRKKPMAREKPVLFTVEKLRELAPSTPEAAQTVRLQVFEAVQSKLVPNSIALDYFRQIYPSFGDFWLFRRQVAYQLAALSFMTYVMFMRERVPGKMYFSRSTGNVWGSELVPYMAPNAARFQNNEAVQIRLTPNLQMLLGPIAQEGIFSASILVIAKALAEPFTQEPASAAQRQPGGPQEQTATTSESKMEQMLSVFIRDEVNFWCTANHRPSPSGQELRHMVDVNSEMIVKRSIALARSPVEGMLPANQTVIDLICKSVSPAKLSQMDSAWMPFL